MLPLGELTQARSRQISVGLNRSGSASFTIPMNDDLGQMIYPHIHGMIAYRIGSTGVKMIWSGYVNTIDEDIANNKMTVNCVGWQDRLAKRFPHQNLTYANQDDAVIIQNLLGEANGQLSGEYVASTTSIVMADGITLSWPSGSSPNVSTFMKYGGTLPNEGVGGSTAYTTTSRSATFTKYQTSILQAIQQITEIENACDMWVHPASRQIYIFRKRRTIRTSVIFGFQWGPSNVAAFGRQIDGSTTDNMHIVVGAVGTTPAYQSNVPSQSQYGPLEEFSTLSDVTVNSTLQAYASAEVAVKAQPRQLMSLQPFNWTLDGSVPEPFVDYDIGDQVVLVANAPPRIAINQQVRIFGMSFSIDEEDNEKIGPLQIYPGS
jgi:hypothetical protein